MPITQLREKQRLRRKQRKKKMLLAMATITFVICMALISCSATNKQYIVEGCEYKRCDALWDFVALCPEDMDRWAYIHNIMELNGMSDTTVHPDRLYMVPIYKQ